MVRNRKRTAADGHGFSSSNETRRDGEAANEPEVPSRQEARVGDVFAGSLGRTGNGSLLQGHGALHEMLLSDPTPLFPQSYSASSMVNPIDNYGPIRQLERLQHSWASRHMMAANAFGARTGVLGHVTGMDASNYSPGAVRPVSSIASMLSGSSHLSVHRETETARQTIQNIDAGMFNSTKVPCRARGMPKAHNFENAHFIITAETRHGDDLICSHTACREEGAKFCYCTYCKIAGAKRNFRTRHHHFEEASLQTAGSDVDEKMRAYTTTNDAPKSTSPWSCTAEQVAPAKSLTIQANEMRTAQNPSAPTAKEQCTIAINSLTEAESVKKVACTSKKMPYSHNPKSAYFTISKDTKHGDKMICSHQFCREGGFKFIFCSVCKIPVAKRKFKLHAHSSQRSSASSSSTSTNGDGDPKSMPSCSSPPPSTERDTLPADRVQAWNKLLVTRPPKDDREAFAKWIEDIFIVSSGQKVDHHSVPDISAIVASLLK